MRARAARAAGAVASRTLVRPRGTTARPRRRVRSRPPCGPSCVPVATTRARRRPAPLVAARCVRARAWRRASDRLRSSRWTAHGDRPIVGAGRQVVARFAAPPCLRVEGRHVHLMGQIEHDRRAAEREAAHPRTGRLQRRRPAQVQRHIRRRDRAIERVVIEARDLVHRVGQTEAVNLVVEIQPGIGGAARAAGARSAPRRGCGGTRQGSSEDALVCGQPAEDAKDDRVRDRCRAPGGTRGPPPPHRGRRGPRRARCAGTGALASRRAAGPPRPPSARRSIANTPRRRESWATGSNTRRRGPSPRTRPRRHPRAGWLHANSSR